MTVLGQRIGEYIKQTGLKQKIVAERAGMSQQQISDICNGRRSVAAVEYFRICEALGVDLDYFRKEMQEA